VEYINKNWSVFAQNWNLSLEDQTNNNIKQAGAELWQDQEKLGLAKLALPCKLWLSSIENNKKLCKTEGILLNIQSDIFGNIKFFKWKLSTITSVILKILFSFYRRKKR
jgi:hypothetical protein